MLPVAPAPGHHIFIQTGHGFMEASLDASPQVRPIHFCITPCGIHGMAGFVHTGKDQRNASIPIRGNTGIPRPQKRSEPMDHLIIEMALLRIVPALISQLMGKGFHPVWVLLLLQEIIRRAILRSQRKLFQQLTDSLLQYRELSTDFPAVQSFIRHPHQSIKRRLSRFDFFCNLLFQLESLFQPRSENMVILLLPGFLPFLHQSHS